MGFSLNNNVESVEKYLLSLLPNTIDKSEGSFTQMLVGLLAVESSQLANLLDVLLQQSNIVTMTNEFLDAKAYEYNLTRTPGAYATTTLTLVGVDGTVVPEGTVFATREGTRFETTEDVTIVSPSVDVNARAEEIGSEGNIVTNALVDCVDVVIGLTSFSHPTATGGMDQEDDEQLRLRCIIAMQRPAASGNAAHYVEWAKTINGVDEVKVIPVHAGPGTVKLICKNTETGVVDQTILDEVSSYIATQMPIGVNLTVVSATRFNLNIVVTATYTEGSNATNMKPIVLDAINRYVRTLNGGDSISYNRLLSEIIQLEGIRDITNMTLNGGKVNITLPVDNVVYVQGLVVA